MITVDTVLRIATFMLLFSRVVYWLKSANLTNSTKPKHMNPTLLQKVKDYILFFLWALLGAQLLGLSLVAFSYHELLQCFGFLLATNGIVVSVLGRRELGVNWAHGGEYQIKYDQELVTTGIYHHIRHPIYLGVIFAYLGGKIVAGSYLAILFLLLFTNFAIAQAKKEEKLLIHHFGQAYKDYMRDTIMLIPFVF